MPTDFSDLVAKSAFCANVLGTSKNEALQRNRCIALSVLFKLESLSKRCLATMSLSCIDWSVLCICFTKLPLFNQKSPVSYQSIDPSCQLHRGKSTDDLSIAMAKRIKNRFGVENWPWERAEFNAHHLSQSPSPPAISPTNPASASPKKSV